MKKLLKIFSLLLVLTTFIATGCQSGGDTEDSTKTEKTQEAKETEASYNYISPADLKTRIDAGDLESGKMVMIDSQTAEEFREASHIKGVIPTMARPLEADSDFAKLDPALELIADTDSDIILICPGGKSGATRPFDYFAEKGIDTDRMLILEGGQTAYAKEFPEDVAKSYISSEDLRARLQAGEVESGKLVMITTQTEEEYKQFHLEDAIATYARPLESDEDYAKLGPAIEQVKDGNNDIILICPRGGSGATKPFDYFAEKGIDMNRMLILEGGQEDYAEKFPEDVVVGE